MAEPIVVVLKGAFVWLIRWIPSWVLRRKFNNTAMIEGFGVELMSPTSLDIRLNGDDPAASLRLRLLNLTPLTFEVEKIHLEITVAQRKIATVDHTQRLRVNPYTAIPPLRYGAFSGMSDPKVYLHSDLDTGRAASLRKHLESAQDRRAEVELMIWLEGTSQLGRFNSPPMEVRIPAASAGIWLQPPQAEKA